MLWIFPNWLSPATWVIALFVLFLLPCGCGWHNCVFSLFWNKKLPVIFLPKNPFSSFKDPSVLPTIHPLVEFLCGWLISNLENIHSRTTAPNSVNTFVQTPRNCQFLTMLREIRSQTNPNGDDLVNYTIAPLIRPLSPNSKWWSSYKSKGSLINSDALNISSQFYFR